MKEIENKVSSSSFILKSIGMPEPQTSEMPSLVLLAMAKVYPNNSWSTATNDWIRIHDILEFLRENYKKDYAENSRETVRKQAIHHFRNAAIIEDNGVATNSPNYRYRLTTEALILIQQFENENWELILDNFLKKHLTLIDIYSSKKVMQQIPVNINNLNLSLSIGEHNQLQKAIIESFLHRFAPYSVCLYIGDTTNKNLINEQLILQKLGFNISIHNKMPDVVLYSEKNNWIYFIEAVTSVGPMSPKRILEIEEMTKNVTAGKIFVTAFLDLKTCQKFIPQIAWETEIWIAENPDHMIHLNGDKFLGPRQ